MSDARLVNFVKYSDKLRNEREDQRGWEWSPDDPACQGADVLNSSSSKVTAQYAENFVPWIRDGVYRHHIRRKNSILRADDQQHNWNRQDSFGIAKIQLRFFSNMYAIMVNSPGLLETYLLAFNRFCKESGDVRLRQTEETPIKSKCFAFPSRCN